MHTPPPSYKLYEFRPLPPLPLGATPSPQASPTPRARPHTPNPFSRPFYSPPLHRPHSPSSSHSSPHSSPRPRPGAFSPPPRYPSPYSTPSLYTLGSYPALPSRPAPRVSRPPSGLCLPLEPLPESDVVDTAERASALLADARGLEDALGVAETRARERRESVCSMERDMEARARRREAVLAAARAVMSG